MSNGHITAQGTYKGLLAEGIDFHAALHDDTGAATPSPGVTPTHRSPAATSPFPPSMSPQKAAEAAAAPLMAISEPIMPVSNGTAHEEEFSDVTALLLGDLNESIDGTFGKMR